MSSRAYGAAVSSRLILLPIAFTFVLAGCGPQVSAPSLLPRAVEKQPINMPLAEPVETQSPADPALTARISKLIADAEAGDRAFAEQRARTEATIARASGTAAGGELWVQAQQELTSLESARVPVRNAAGDVDALRLEPANASTGNRAAIDAAAARIAAIDSAEGAAVAALARKLG